MPTVTANGVGRVDGGRLINAAHPVVLRFVDEVLAAP